MTSPSFDRDLENARWIYAKAAMFVVIGCAAFGLVLAQCPTVRVALLLILMIWAFCRAYYFAFYVIEKYIDAEYKFSGLTSFVVYLLHRKKS